MRYEPSTEVWYVSRKMTNTARAGIFRKGAAFGDRRRLASSRFGNPLVDLHALEGLDTLGNAVFEDLEVGGGEVGIGCPSVVG